MLENCRVGWHPLLCLAGRSGLCATIFILKYLQLSHFDPLPPWNCSWSPLLFRCYTFCCLSHVLPFNPPPPRPPPPPPTWSLEPPQLPSVGPLRAAPPARWEAAGFSKVQLIHSYPYFSYFLFSTWCQLFDAVLGLCSCWRKMYCSDSNKKCKKKRI